MNKISFYNQGVKPLKFRKDILKEFLIEMLKNEGYQCGEVNVIFCTDDHLLELNREYLKHDYYTDIITFDNTINHIVYGELFISLERVQENAEFYEVKILEELLRVVFHGFLHLTGYKDKKESEIMLMREKENFYLSEYLNRK